MRVLTFLLNCRNAPLPLQIYISFCEKINIRHMQPASMGAGSMDAFHKSGAAKKRIARRWQARDSSAQRFAKTADVLCRRIERSGVCDVASPYARKKAPSHAGNGALLHDCSSIDARESSMRRALFYPAGALQHAGHSLKKRALGLGAGILPRAQCQHKALVQRGHTQHPYRAGYQRRNECAID